MCIRDRYNTFDTIPQKNGGNSERLDEKKLIWEIIGKIVPYIDVHDDFATIIRHLHLEGTAICDLCKNYYKDVADKILNNNLLYTELENIAYDVCMKKNKNETSCHALLIHYIDNFINNYRLHRFDYKYQCGYQFECFGFKQLNWQDYQAEVLADKPPVKTVEPTLKQTYKVLHLTDIHYELSYTVNTFAFDCGLSVCCWPQNGFTSNASLQAQYWGQVSTCDIPYRTAEQAIQFAADYLKPDLILWTGDSNGHATWYQKEENQLVQMKKIGQLITEKFPNIPIYPIYGNHEDYPINEYNYKGNRTLINTAVAEWEKFLDADALQQLKTNGYYSTYNEIFKLRIITIFTCACNVLDFYLISQPTDPLQELEWLRAELYKAEQKNENVIIQGHILIQAGDCSNAWTHRYNALIDRFQNIIRGQFYGHTHYDSVGVQHSNITKEPIGVQWVTPSLTTYPWITPGLRVYEFDLETSNVVNHETYRLYNMSEWNKNTTTGPLVFQKAYDFVSEYGLKDYITLSQMDTLTKKFANIKNAADAALTQKYIYYYWTETNPKIPIEQLQNNKTLWIKEVCEAENGVYEEIYHCIGDYQEVETDFDEFMGIGSFSQIWYTLNESQIAKKKQLKLSKFLSD
eukprot:TRINITY_DN1172_c0_g1_i2.p1 TRINITY_DN1172_c0_g1~~TRINITY_DN1172_c0_g1_i2.p1  ORF type:complete len:631 (+),score=82.08 TRINITY_DN1172_c0_g1_i2:147-2039(+)